MRSRNRPNRNRSKNFRNTATAGQRRQSQILDIMAFLPVSLALQTRRKIYTYPSPNQRQLQRRNLRHTLKRPREKTIPTVVKIRVPRTLPLVKRSMVDWRNGKTIIRSKLATDRVIHRGEQNRARKQERKGGYRRANHGQPDSPGAHNHGLVAEALYRGLSPNRIADAALVARAIK